MEFSIHSLNLCHFVTGGEQLRLNSAVLASEQQPSYPLDVTGATLARAVFIVFGGVAISTGGVTGMDFRYQRGHACAYEWDR
jgi:hypothetical protein